MLIDEQAAHSNIERIVRKAAETDTFVRLDMEDHRATRQQSTLQLQCTQRAYLTLELFYREGCSGQWKIYGMCAMPQKEKLTSESARDISGALRYSVYSYEDIVDATNRAIDEMLDSGAYTAIASHDVPVIEHS